MKDRSKITKATPITVEGVDFETYVDCAEVYGLTAKGVKYRVNSDVSFPEWNLRGQRKTLRMDGRTAKKATDRVRAIRRHITLRKHRVSFAEVEQAFDLANVCPTDKRYRLETNLLTKKVYVVKKRECMSPEEKRLHIYITDKKTNCRMTNTEFLLTEEQVKQKLDEAGITIWQVGQGTVDTCGEDFYQLCRVGDTGPYDMTSSFKTQRENIAEMYDRKDA